MESGWLHDDVNTNLLRVQYAVRGPLLDRTEEIEREIREGVKKPFPRVVRANLGDCHAMGQPSLTFLRQVVSLAAWPALLEGADVPGDVKDRVRVLLGDCLAGTVGSYSPPLGLQSVRAAAAAHCARRDLAPVHAEDIVLGNGAAELLQQLFELIPLTANNGMRTGVLLPCPQYPLFSGLVAARGLVGVPYQLAEGGGWRGGGAALGAAALDAERQAVCLRAVVVINPGNPTGQVMSHAEVEEVVRFARQRDLLIIADEVYQDNVIQDTFVSFNKVMHDMGPPYRGAPLCSLVSVSKGWSAECGARAAALLMRAPGSARRGLTALRGLAQCPNVLGQVALHCVLSPPPPGSPSHALWSSEVRARRALLTSRAARAAATLGALPGVDCFHIQGGLYMFPRLHLPPRALREARARGVPPDEMYCREMLENTGICIIPGSGFGQAEGTWHFRATILHAEDDFNYLMDGITRFHNQFMAEYED